MHRRRRQQQPDSQISLRRIQEQVCLAGFIFKADWSQLPLLWSSKSTIEGAGEGEEEGMGKLEHEMNLHAVALHQLILDDNF